MTLPLLLADQQIATTEHRFDGRTLLAPESWGQEAIELFADALILDKPATLKAVEENTRPSWLWRHHPARSAKTEAENDVMHVFHRAVGAATAEGWRAGLWSEEDDAKAFYDETCAMLGLRLLALPPALLGVMGTSWAYGQQPPARPIRGSLPVTSAVAPDFETEEVPTDRGAAIGLRNATIDRLLQKSEPTLSAKWSQLFAQASEARTLSVRFQDTAREWADSCSTAAPQAALDLFRFLRDDGGFDVAAFRQAVRNGVFLLTLSSADLGLDRDPERKIALGFTGLGALLMGMGIAYDSAAGRTTAAAIAAIMSAESLLASADLAAKLGPAPAYKNKAEAKRRQIRNQYRAAHGERTDFERLSVLPDVLEVRDDADLVLVALARHSWEVALHRIDRFGLANLEQTGVLTDPTFGVFLESSSFGFAPEATLVAEQADEVGTSRHLNPAFRLGLQRAGLDPAIMRALVERVAGTRTLAGAPGFSPADLETLGFPPSLIATIEDRLPETSSLRTLITQWTLGESCCRSLLGERAESLDAPSFDLLRALGVDDATVEAADAYIFGTGSVVGSKLVAANVKARFATEPDVAPTARVKMAAALQPFFAADVGLTLGVGDVPSAMQADLVLTAWREGLRSVTLSISAARTRMGRRLAQKIGVVAKTLRAGKPAVPTPPHAVGNSVTRAMHPLAKTPPKAKATLESLGARRAARTLAIGKRK
jgi:hypothetical protein